MAGGGNRLDDLLTFGGKGDLSQIDSSALCGRERDSSLVAVVSDAAARQLLETGDLVRARESIAIEFDDLNIDRALGTGEFESGLDLLRRASGNDTN